jgi:hypothetical protein
MPTETMIRNKTIKHEYLTLHCSLITLHHHPSYALHFIPPRHGSVSCKLWYYLRNCKVSLNSSFRLFLENTVIFAKTQLLPLSSSSSSLPSPSLKPPCLARTPIFAVTTSGRLA